MFLGYLVKKAKPMEELSDEQYREEVSNRIRFFRQSRLMTQEQLGEQIGAGTANSAKTMIAKIENGQIPGGIRLKRITEVLGCSADMLIAGLSRDLAEVIRFHVRPSAKLDANRMSIFRVGKIMLFCAVTLGENSPGDEFMEAANRLFYIAENEPEICIALHEEMTPGEDHTADRMAQAGDLRGLVRHAMQKNGKDPVGYSGYNYATTALKAVEKNYVPPEVPPIAKAMLESREESLACRREQGGAGDKPVRPVGLPVLKQMKKADAPKVRGSRAPQDGTCLVKVEGDGMEPLARAGQYVMVAPRSRKPADGDLVVCWSREHGMLYSRFFQKGGKIHLLSVSPSDPRPLILEHDDMLGLRIVTGVWFE